MYTETIKYNDFMSGDYKIKTGDKKLSQVIRRIGISITMPLVFAKPVLAAEAVPAATKDSIIHAFDPLIDLMISLALPIAGVMITGGALLILIGQKEKGFTLILNSALGYCLVQLCPLFLTLLEQVGKAI
ncbi:hypothetical protein [Bacillus benzoevorans]|uniref:TrbC/VIRB2 family protein n=2 Tax=Bacillus benzoevorans TaxID=1456 RepID=A0A7X0LWA5_9BACI|nr:hypothetical protein [Bacillus benzoevorans]MBB6446425.1 hypothetical protein [Bacillus benzoevorans]